uniref:Uncharacterized protein n=1 Tax=Arundo donax TaxID=35708 RepID=A0A0A9GSV4_ARUDO
MLRVRTRAGAGDGHRECNARVRDNVKGPYIIRISFVLH